MLILRNELFRAGSIFIRCDFRRWQLQVGSLAGAAHLLNNNTGVLRWTPWEQKSHLEHKGKSPFDLYFQYECKTGNRGLTILLSCLNLMQEVSEKLPQG